ncbi:MAG: nicotinamide mononucleotide transporter [Clostridia bacterium]|nr:nicotinamide mononucleotide transporter [Clostridia bacterium]
MKERFRVSLTRFEWVLWGLSICVVAGTAIAFRASDWVSVLASLIGVTALIFVAKGHALGQVLTIVFAVFYGIISWAFRYYGEAITYLGMTAPMAVVALVTWLRNPYRDSAEVAVRRLNGKHWAVLCLCAAAVTAAFWFILRAIGNAALMVSTLSITTSFVASWLTAVRSPYYALAYALNDLVLIVLWVIAALADISSVPMVACFGMFFANDLYGFINWRRMERRQQEPADGVSDC